MDSGGNLGLDNLSKALPLSSLLLLILLLPLLLVTDPGLEPRIVLCLVTQSCPALCNAVDCSPPGSSVHGDPPGKNTGVGFHALLQGIFQPRSPALQMDSLPSEPPGKPRA